MLEKLLPRKGKSLFWFAVIPFIAGAAAFSKKTHVTANDRDEDVYLIGRQGNPKAVFVTNQTPKKAVKSAAKKYIESIKD